MPPWARLRSRLAPINGARSNTALYAFLAGVSMALRMPAGIAPLLSLYPPAAATLIARPAKTTLLFFSSLRLSCFFCSRLSPGANFTAPRITLRRPRSTWAGLSLATPFTKSLTPRCVEAMPALMSWL